MSNSNQHIAIIGNGISGITCARHIRKQSNHSITVISSESQYFFSRTALMYAYMGHMQLEHLKPYEDSFWKKNRIDLIHNTVTQIDTKAQNLILNDNTSIAYDQLVIASGSKYNTANWPGQELKGVQGLYHLQDLELMENNTKGISNAVIVGGGLIGIEMAEMLRSRNIKVTMLVREQHFWGSILPKEEAELIERYIAEHHVDLRLNSELQSIHGDDSGKVKSIITKNGEEIPCQFVGLTIGVSPNINFLKNSDIETDRGILVNEFLESNIPNVYAIGDCAQFRSPKEGRKAIEQVWYTGRMQAETLAHTLTGKQTAYNPGHWFNSAKFFDIEYQTYGWVGNTLNKNESTFYWEHPNGKISFRANYDSANRQLIGVNIFGMRMRHEVFDRWLSEQRDIDFVIAHLHQANFDPEFFTKHEVSIQRAFHSQTPSLA